MRALYAMSLYGSRLWLCLLVSDLPTCEAEPRKTILAGGQLQNATPHATSTLPAPERNLHRLHVW